MTKLYTHCIPIIVSIAFAPMAASAQDASSGETDQSSATGETAPVAEPAASEPVAKDAAASPDVKEGDNGTVPPAESQTSPEAPADAAAAPDPASDEAATLPDSSGVPAAAMPTYDAAPTTERGPAHGSSGCAKGPHGDGHKSCSCAKGPKGEGHKPCGHAKGPKGEGHKPCGHAKGPQGDGHKPCGRAQASAERGEHQHWGRPAPRRGPAGAARCGGFGQQFNMKFGGYLRTEYSTFTTRRIFGVRVPADERNAPGVGRNDGFALGGARLNLRGTYRDALYFRLGFDGSLVSYANQEDLQGELGTGLKDAYMRYRLDNGIEISAGRFKPPYDVEELTPTAEQFFVHRSLESRGVRRHEGYVGDREGLRPGRQLGLMVSDNKAFSRGPLELGYALALTNGNGDDAALNDNDLPALYGRVSIGWGAGKQAGVDEEGPATYSVRDGVVVGLGAGVNQVSVGAAPTWRHQRVYSGGGDIAARVGPVIMTGQLLAALTESLDIGADDTLREMAWGGHLQLSLDVPGQDIAPGVRYATYDPRVVDGDDFGGSDFDRVQHISVGMRWAPTGWPVVGLIDYTHSVEQGLELNNNRIEMALQVTFQ